MLSASFCIAFGRLAKDLQASHELLVTVLWKEGGCVVGMADDDGCKAAECCLN